MFKVGMTEDMSTSGHESYNTAESIEFPHIFIFPGKHQTTTPILSPLVMSEFWSFAQVLRYGSEISDISPIRMNVKFFTFQKLSCVIGMTDVVLLDQSVVMKRELCLKVKISVYLLTCITNPTHGPKLWQVTKIQLWMQVASWNPAGGCGWGEKPLPTFLNLLQLLVRELTATCDRFQRNFFFCFCFFGKKYSNETSLCFQMSYSFIWVPWTNFQSSLLYWWHIYVKTWKWKLIACMDTT